MCALAGLVVCQFVLGWLRVGIEQRALLALHETNASLVQARTALASLKTGFGFSMGEWTKLQREKAALERFVRLKFGDVEVRDCDLPSDVGAASGA